MDGPASASASVLVTDPGAHQGAEDRSEREFVSEVAFGPGQPVS